MEILEERRLLAVVNAFQTGDWHSATTWVGGEVPNASDRVIVGQGKTVTLDGIDHAAKEIVVHGTLTVAEDNSSSPQTKTLTSDWIHVNSNGVFQIGNAANRYDNNQFVLTLTGVDPEADFVVETAMGNMDINDNNGFLMTTGGGRLQFFGEEKLSFTKLASTASVGDSTITVENVIERNFDGTTSAGSDGSLNWEIGEEIVIASSSYEYEDEEVRTVTGVSVQGDQTILTLNAPLAHRHYGEIESYSNSSRTFDIDLRAEVARLNRSITIQGTQDTDSRFGNRARYGTTTGKNVGIGAHTMIMPGSGQITVDGVRFDKMGQTGRLGRYPMHWHLARDRSGDVMRNSSVTNSNNRGVTIHGTQNVLFEGNVLHDIHGHGFFMEDAAETGNQFLSNIVLGIHRVGGGNRNDPFIIPGITRGPDGKVNGEAARNGNGESSHDTGQNVFRRFLHSSAYWITNPDNTWVGNIAAGSEGSGFWFALPDGVTALSKDTGLYNNLNPIRTNLRQFDNNTTHSAPVGLTFDRGSDIKPGSSNNYAPPTKMQINGLTSYKHDGTAVYHRGSVGTFNESRFADNANSSFNTFRQEERNILFVGHSIGNSDPSATVGGYRLYDGPGTIRNSHFAGFAADNAFTFRIESGANKHAHTRAEGITFEDDGTADHLSIEFNADSGGIANDNSPTFVAGRPDVFAGLVLDLDGSLTGHAGGGPGYVLTPRLDHYRDSTDIAPVGWNAYISDDRFGQFKLGTINNTGTIPDFRIENGDGHAIVSNRRNLAFVQRTYTKLNAGDYTVTFQDPVPTAGFDVFLQTQLGNEPGDATVFRFKDVAQDFKPQSIAEVDSLTALRRSTQTSFLRDYAGDLWMKIFQSSRTIEVKPTNESLPTNPQQAYSSVTYSNGARIEAEEFDEGGQGFAVWDTTTNNQGGAFRSNQGVDIQSTNDLSGGFHVGFTRDGEFLEYTADVVAALYDLDFRVASNVADAKSIRVLIGDGDAAETFTDLGNVSIPDTGGFQSWQTVSLPDVDLTSWQGSDRVFRLEIIGGSFNLNWFEFADQQDAFVDQTITHESRLIAEEFDLGGEGVGYHDTTPGNAGGSARTSEDVDVYGSGNIVLGNIRDGEWVEYTRDVVGDIYDIGLRVASSGAETKNVLLSIAENDSTDIYTQLGTFQLAQTNGYEVFTLQDVDLRMFDGADRVFRVDFIQGQMNFDFLEFTSKTAAGPRLTVSVTDSAISENGGTTTATISRNSDTTSELIVMISSSDTSEANVPTSVTIAAGETTSDPFTITSVDDSTIDGPQIVTVTAVASGHAEGNDLVEVTDDEATNDPPVLDHPIGDQVAVEDALLAFTFPSDAFRDPDGDALTYSLTLASGDAVPDWIGFDSASRTLSGTPDNDDVGTLNLKLTAMDPNAHAVSDEFLLTILNTNDLPQLNQSIGDQSVLEDDLFQFSFATTFSDVDGDDLSYSASLSNGSPLPPWLTFDGPARTLTGTPKNSDVGTIEIELSAFDPDSETASDVFELTIVNTNDGPRLTTGIADQTTLEDTPFVFDFDEDTFFDPDGDSLSYTAFLAVTVDGDSPLPNWLNFSEATRSFSGTPSNGDVGTINIKVIATDPFGLSIEDTFLIEVANANDTPLVNRVIESRFIAETLMFDFTFPENTFIDPDGDTLLYTSTLSDGADLPAWLTFTSESRNFLGTPTSDDVGTLSIDVTATDAAGMFAMTQFNLDVTELTPIAVDDNQFVSNEDSVLALTLDQLLANDQHADLDNGSIFDFLSGIVETSLGGRLTVDSGLRTISYDASISDELQQLKPGESRQDSFQYRIQDQRGVSSFADVNLMVQGRNDAPKAKIDLIAVSPDRDTVIDPFANDIDVDGTIDPSSIQIITAPESGELSLEDGVLTYTPSDSFDGQDSFVYTVTDEFGLTSRATSVELFSGPVSETIISGTSVGRSVTLDVESSVQSQSPLILDSLMVLTGSISGTDPAEGYGPRHGSVAIRDGNLVYTPNAGSIQWDDFHFTVEDANGGRSAPIQVMVNTVESRLQNPVVSFDVDVSGEVDALDALLIINRLDRSESGQSSIGVDQDNDFGLYSNGGNNEQFYYDVTGEKIISALDALVVINHVGQQVDPPRPSAESIPFEPLSSAFSHSMSDDISKHVILDELGIISLDEVLEKTIAEYSSEGQAATTWPAMQNPTDRLLPQDSEEAESETLQTHDWVLRSWAI